MVSKSTKFQFNRFILFEICILIKVRRKFLFVYFLINYIDILQVQGLTLTFFANLSIQTSSPKF
jgi:hypothetical protein